MRRRIFFVGLGLLAALLSTAWINRSYIDSYLTNEIGAPSSSETDGDVQPGDSATVRFAVAGDVGTGGLAAYQTAATIDSLEDKREYDALLLLGDNVYDNGDPTDIGVKVFEPFAAVLDDRTQLLAVLGNHDVRDNNGPAQAEALGMPNEWYATQVDNTTIIALDSNQVAEPEQISWLRTTLSTITTDWTIVMMHHPAYSAGWHGSNVRVQADFVPLFEKYDVDLVLSGHDHDYQRSNTINGVTYIVTGAAAKLRPTGSEDFTAVSWSTHSFVDLAVYPDRIEGQAIDHQGRAIDSFTIPGA